MIARIAQKAVENIARVFSSKRQLGRLAGTLAAGVVIRQVLTIVIRDRDGRKERKQISLNHLFSLYVDANGTINDQGVGSHVAIVYLGNDGKYYKEFDGRWWSWQGADWVQV